MPHHLILLMNTDRRGVIGGRSPDSLLECNSPLFPTARGRAIDCRSGKQLIGRRFAVNITNARAPPLGNTRVESSLCRFVEAFC